MTTSSSDGVSGCARELLDTAPALIQYIRFHMRRHRKGLTVPQFRALYKVRTEPGASLSMVAEHLSASLPTTSRVVATLVAKGYLTRGDRAGDRRQISLHITPRGRAIVDAANAATQTQMESQMTRLSIQDRATLWQAMHILRRALNPVDTRPHKDESNGNTVADRKSRRRRAKSSSEPAIIAPIQRG